jgi:hypothetical protein
LPPLPLGKRQLDNSELPHQCTFLPAHRGTSTPTHQGLQAFFMLYLANPNVWEIARFAIIYATHIMTKLLPEKLG